MKKRIIAIITICTAPFCSMAFERTESIKSDTNIVQGAYSSVNKTSLKNPIYLSKKKTSLYQKESSNFLGKTNYLNTMTITPLSDNLTLKRYQTDMFGNVIPSRHGSNPPLNTSNILGNTESFSVEYTFKKKNK